MVHDGVEDPDTNIIDVTDFHKIYWDFDFSVREEIIKDRSGDNSAVREKVLDVPGVQDLGAEEDHLVEELVQLPAVVLAVVIGDALQAQLGGDELTLVGPGMVIVVNHEGGVLQGDGGHEVGLPLEAHDGQGVRPGHVYKVACVDSHLRVLCESFIPSHAS